MEQPSALPESWINRIFDKLLLTYGQAWLNKWAGLNIDTVKSDWAHELRGFQANPQAIKYALEHLPADMPPTVLQFRSIAIRRPDEPQKALPSPKADERVVSAVMSGIKRSSEGIGHRGWARELRRREQQCERLTKAQRDMWRDALRAETAIEVTA